MTQTERCILIYKVTMYIKYFIEGTLLFFLATIFTSCEHARQKPAIFVVDDKKFCSIHHCQLTSKTGFRYDGFIDFNPKLNKLDEKFPNRWPSVCSHELYDGYKIPITVSYCLICTESYNQLAHP